MMEWKLFGDEKPPKDSICIVSPMESLGTKSYVFIARIYRPRDNNRIYSEDYYQWLLHERKRDCRNDDMWCVITGDFLRDKIEF